MADLEFIVCKIQLESLSIVHLIQNCYIQHHMREAWDLTSVTKESHVNHTSWLFKLHL